jgi:hypothetical protein
MKNLSALRAARAEAVYQTLAVELMLSPQLIRSRAYNCKMTPSQYETALSDLASTGRISFDISNGSVIVRRHAKAEGA